MATSTDVSYSTPSGVPLYIGLAVPSPSPNVVFVGDSLTSLSYGPLHPYTWAIGLAGGVLKPLANSSVANNTIQDIINRLDNHYTDVSPGLAGLGLIGRVFFRGGTNDFRGGQSIGSGTQAQYIEAFTKILTYSEHCDVFAVPPVGNPGDTSGQGIPGVNAWLSSYCSGNPRLHFINDCVTVDNGSGNWVSGYASGESPPVHFTNPASYQMGLDGGAALASLLASYGYASPVSLDAADVYPTVDQWCANHRMTGTGGSNSLGSGQVPTSWSVGAAGGGYTATTSIVPADVGDPNTAPWLRITPTTIGNDNSWIGVGPTVDHDAVTTLYPDALEIVFEIRFNSFDGSKFKGLQFSVYGSSNEQVAPVAYLRMGHPTPISETVIVRSAINRSASGRLSHTTAVPDIRFESAGTYSGAMGSFDIRCMTIRSH